MESPKSPPSTVPAKRSQSSRQSPSQSSRVDRRPSTTSQKLGTPIFTQDAVPLHSTVGQVSFAPTTQTTVVTTTTTTTTSFPPFVMKAPKNLSHRNPEQYPLAASPTPQAIRKLKFQIGGQTAYFEEANELADQHHEKPSEQNNTQPQSAALQDVFEYSSSHDTSTAEASPEHETIDVNSALIDQEENIENLRNRSATPISLSDATELHSFHRRNSQPSRPPYNIRRSHRFVPRAQMIGETRNETYNDSTDQSLHGNENFSKHRGGQVSTCKTKNRDEDSMPSGTQQQQQEDNEGFLTPIQPQSTVDPFIDSTENPNRPRPTLPAAINTSPVQDVSLPSPSLSPITAATNLQRLNSSRFDTSLSSNRPTTRRAHEDTTTASERLHALSNAPNQLELPPVEENEFENNQLPTPGFADVPELLETFDQMPDDMKTYVMYQLLRRCAKPTLKFVKSVVDPALKVDFINRLPLELSLQVTKYLDAKSMCRASQVSKRWRNILDSDEKAWKDLMIADGFKPQSGELDRAIREGWGWQMPTNSKEWDVDLSQDKTPTSTSFPQIEDNITSLPESSPSHSASQKRKRKSSRLPPQKKQKTKASSSSNVSTSQYFNEKASAYGPNAYANAAAVAVPNPGIGLPNITSLHFFKSLYRRHHQLRKSWMQPETKPLHLAFRAHQRHVVTCLQFDNNKILTGSDDSNIDIYDTSTGATINRLSGHDGGVWALEYRGNLLVSGSTDRSVRVWDMRDGKMLHVFQGHTSTVRCLQILEPVKIGEVDGVPIMRPKRPLIITGSRDTTCRVWRLPEIDAPSFIQAGPAFSDEENPYFVRTLPGHSSSVRAIAAHGDTLVSGSYDSTVRVWKISTGEAIHRLQGHTQKVYSVVLDHVRNRCISGSMDNSVKVWDLEYGTNVFSLSGHSSLVGLLDLKDDVLVSAAADATLRVWEPESGRCKKILRAHTGAITCFMHDGQKIISGSDRTLKMWDTTTGKCARDLLTDLSGVWQIKFDERRCIAAVQRNDWTYIEVLDFGASADGVPASRLGRRIAVDSRGRELPFDSDYPGQSVIQVAQ